MPLALGGGGQLSAGLLLPALHPVWGGWPLPRLGHDRLCRGLSAGRRGCRPRLPPHRCQGDATLGRVLADTVGHVGGAGALLLPRSCAGAGVASAGHLVRAGPLRHAGPGAHRGVGPAGCPGRVLHPAVWQLFCAGGYRFLRPARAGRAAHRDQKVAGGDGYAGADGGVVQLCRRPAGRRRCPLCRPGHLAYRDVAKFLERPLAE